MSDVMNTTARTPKRLKDLLRVLDGMCELHERLGEAVRAKLDAIGRADVDAMQEASDREQALCSRLSEREGLRKQLMDLVGVEIGLGERDGRSLTVTELCARLERDSRDELKRSADALRKTVADVAQANRACEVSTRALLHHLHWVFASVRPKGDPPIGYSGAGRAVSDIGTQLVDTVG